MEAILVAAVPPIVTAALAGLGIWLRRRTRAHRDQRMLEQARARIAVISAWLEAHRQLDPADEEGRRRALADLELTYSQITGVEGSPGEHPKSRLGPMLRALLLLDSGSSSVLATLVKILYFVSLAWLLLWVAAAFMFGLGAGFIDTGESLGLRLMISVGLTLLCLAVGIAPALVLYLVHHAATQPSASPVDSTRSGPEKPGGPRPRQA